MQQVRPSQPLLLKRSGTHYLEGWQTQGPPQLSCSANAKGNRLWTDAGVVVAMIMYIFPRVSLLALGPVPLLVTLFATHKALVVVVPAVPLFFPTSGFDTLAWVVLVTCTSLRLDPLNSYQPSVTLFCHLPTFSIAGLNYRGSVPAWKLC